MKRNLIKTAILCMIAGLILSGCGKSANITITPGTDKVHIGLAGTGTAVVNWGDGKSETLELKGKDWVVIKHTYMFGDGGSTIKISGENITALGCEENKLTALELSNNTALTHLQCGKNQLTTLDLSKNTELKYLDCRYNQLTALDLSKNTALTKIICENNQLTALDISNSTALTKLDCDNNQLSALDVSRNTSLTEFECSKNQLSALELSKNTALTSLRCESNQLTALDLSKNVALTWITCGANQLSIEALNALFGSLNDKKTESKIFIGQNPGTHKCDMSIAKSKGWTVVYIEIIS